MGKGVPDARSRAAVALDLLCEEAEQELAPEERTAVAFGRELERIKYQVLQRKARRREVVDGGGLYERAVDETGTLGDHERKVIFIAKYHPNERMRQEAVRLLVLANQRWVIKEAQSKRFSGRGVSFEELCQQGNIGLMEAIEQYDPARSYTSSDGSSKYVTFLTYAKSKIFMRMQRYTEQQSANLYGARLPTTVYGEMGKVRKALGALGAEPADFQNKPEELAEFIYQSEVRDYEAGRAPRKNKPRRLDAEKVRMCLDMLRAHPVSLQQRLRADEDSMELGDTLEHRSPAPDEQAVNNDLAQTMLRAFASLEPDEQRVAGSLWGYGGYERLDTMREIAERYGINGGEVMKLRNSAKNKIAKALRQAGYDIDELLGRSKPTVAA